MKPVAVMIPTLRRPAGLTRALQSLFRQTGAVDLLAEIVVVDNAPEGSAWSVIETLRHESPWPLVYVHMPQPGVANARNAGVCATQARFIAFLDDDEMAAPDWLSRLYAAHVGLGCDVTFGPIDGVADGAPPKARAWLDSFFSRHGPKETGLISQSFGCGNSIMTRATALPGHAPFDPASNRGGGEDDRLFQALSQSGGRFGWACDAWVKEYAPPRRATPAYALTRAVAYGQGPAKACARANPCDWLGVGRWMLIGAAQAALFAPAFLILWLLQRPGAWPMADRAARGLGKIIWMRPLEFYGTASPD